MKRKTKLFFSLVSLCFTLAVLCFGVYSALSVSYSISGSVSYEVTDCFVDITTTVYSSNAIAQSDEELLSLANEFVNAIPNTIGDNKTVTHVTEYDDVFDFNTLTGTLDENNGYTPETSLDLTFGTVQNAYTYFVVVNIQNLADNVVYTKISSLTDNLEGLSIVATDSNLRIFSDQEGGQSIVFAYAISDLTQSQDSTPIDFSLSFTSQVPYTYAVIADVSHTGFLGNYVDESGYGVYKNKIKSITFTNNQADFDMSPKLDKFDVGDVYDEEGTKVSELYTYFVPNGNLYDAYCYAPVNVIYAPENSWGFFSPFYSGHTQEGDINYLWQNLNIEKYNFKAFDTSKVFDMSAFMLQNENLVVIENMYFNVNNVKNFIGMFCGTKLNVLDLSQFQFYSSDDNVMNTFGLCGVNDYFLEHYIPNSGMIVGAIGVENKIQAMKTLILLADMVPNEPAAEIAAQSVYNMSIDKIICPKDLNGLIIATPGEKPYLIEGTNEETYVLVEGATLISQE